MTGYEPITLRKLMRRRLYYYVRASHSKGSVKCKFRSLLSEADEEIKSYLEFETNVDSFWKTKALETLSKDQEV